jgi:integrase
MNEGYRWKKKLFSEQGRALLEKLALAPWASRRRQELLELLDPLNPTIEELTAAVEREARKRPEVLRLMSHPGVGPLTALAYVLIIGAPARFQRGKRLADVCDQYRREKDVEPLAADFLAPFNAGKIRPESWITVSEFAEKHWLPWAELNCKPSTVAGYKTLWNTYLAPFVPSKALREFRTVDAANLFAEIHRAKKIGRTTLQHCKSRLNGIFTLARNLGALDSANPVIGAMIPKKAAAPAETYAATPDEVLTILELLRKDGEVKARAAVALMFFAGLRPGGARGACWQDFDGKRLCIRQSVWHKFTTAPKTENAASPVPVIPMLAEILTELRRADGNPADGPILRGPSKKPLLLDNLSKRIVIPALRRCATCGEQESGHKTEHDFKLDESLPTWHGWYSLRRGVATTLAGLTRDGMASKGLLRHTNLATTTRHYVKDVPENTQSAMILLETLCNRSATDSDTRPN